jgi:hypothetical protein
VTSYDVINDGDKLSFSMETAISPESASKWTDEYIQQLKILFDEVSINEFFKDYESISENLSISTDAEELLKSLNNLGLNNRKEYLTRVGDSAIEMQTKRENGELMDPIRKSLFLLEYYSNNEALMDSFIYLLLYRLGYYNEMLFPIPQLSLDLIFGTDKSNKAKADYVIQDILSSYKMAVIEDKSKDMERVNSEPQLIAEAIAVHQQNRLKMESSKRRKLSSSLSSSLEHLSEVDNTECIESMTNSMFGVRVDGCIFSFYNIVITPSILTAMNSKVEATADANVQKIGGLNFLDAGDRKIIITTLDYMKKVITSNGQLSKRKLSR